MIRITLAELNSLSKTDKKFWTQKLSNQIMAGSLCPAISLSKLKRTKFRAAKFFDKRFATPQAVENYFEFANRLN